MKFIIPKTIYFSMSEFLYLRLAPISRGFHKIHIIIKATKKDAGLDFNKLVEYLGGKDNIISTEINKFKSEKI